MNERIEQLADLADELADEIIQTPGEYHPHWHGVRDQKFAELIVKECIDVVKPTSDHEVWADSYLGGVDGLELLEAKVADIKKHFGVKQ